MEQYARLGLMGKHPEYGDFLQAGFSEPLIRGLEQWLDTVLPPMRDTLGNDWAGFWDGGQDLRFWIGRAVLGRTLVGVFRPWRDRAGRRYPFILAAEAADVAAPVVDPDQAPWDRFTAHFEVMQPGQGGVALLNNLQLILPAEDEAAANIGPTLWAHHPDGNLDALLHSAAQPDAERARLNRSYWWAPATMGRSATWLGCPGLPGAQALIWLLTGVPAAVRESEAE